MCTKVCHRRETIKHHLQKEHKVDTSKLLESKIEAYRIGRSCEARFWCGFCNQIVEIKEMGTSAWTERFNHIDDHFSGRNAPRKEIKEWKNADPSLPEMESNANSDSSRPSSPENSVDGTRSLSNKSLSDDGSMPKGKRQRSSDDDEDRETKRLRNAANDFWCCV